MLNSQGPLTILPILPALQQRLSSPSNCPATTFTEAIVGHAGYFSDADCVLLLFDALGGSGIPTLLFEKGRDPQQRWKDDGSQGTMTMHEADIDPKLVALIMSPIQTNRAMQELDTIIESTESSDGYRTYSFLSQVQFTMSILVGQERTQWAIEALKLVYFIFPRDAIWEHR